MARPQILRHFSLAEPAEVHDSRADRGRGTGEAHGGVPVARREPGCLHRVDEVVGHVAAIEGVSETDAVEHVEGDRSSFALLCRGRAGGGQYLVACRHERRHEGASDEARGAGDEHLHVRRSLARDGR